MKVGKIGIEDCIFSIGSCFATEMHEKFSEGQIQTLNNPFGTIFNPYSVFQAIQQVYDAKEYQENDLILPMIITSVWIIIRLLIPDMHINLLRKSIRI
jgi:hypothetical protein